MPSRLARGIRLIQTQGPAALLQKLAGKISRQRLPDSSPSLAQAYPDWIAQNEPGPEELRRQAQAVQGFAYRPLVSILTPVYNPPPELLRAAVSSVLEQTYPHWELCLADGASDRPGVREALQELAASDSRLRLARLAQNLGISGNTNAALEMAQGEFLAFLDHDDLLAPHALFEVVQKLNQDPAWDLLYSDHDLLSLDGSRRYQPLFKPGWSPSVLLSANYLTHLTVARAALVRELGGFDPHLDGAQDWDLFLKISERTRRIAHIPGILYHWRDSAGSTAADIRAKSYAPLAQLRAIGDHLARQGFSQAEAFFDESGFIRLRWAFDRSRKVSIIIPSRGADKLLERCIASIRRLTRYPNYEIIVVNNGEKRPEQFAYYRKITSHPQVRVIHYETVTQAPFNFNSVNNFGARNAAGDLLLFLNNDTQAIAPDWLDELVMWTQRPEVGVVGAKLLSPNGRIQHAGVILGLTGFAGHIFAGQPENQWTIFGLAEWYRDYLAVTAACMLVRREVFERLGGFDESFILCGSDVEICLRARSAGLRVIYNPFARLRHLEGATRQGDIPPEDFVTSYPHYLPALRSGDPYFNPNLSRWQLNPALRQPGEQTSLQFVLDFLQTIREKDENAVLG